MKTLPLALILCSLALPALAQTMSGRSQTPVGSTRESLQHALDQALVQVRTSAQKAGIPADAIDGKGEARQTYRAQLQAQIKKAGDSLLKAMGEDSLSGTSAESRVADYMNGNDIDSKTVSLKDQKDHAIFNLQVQQAREESIQKKISEITASATEKTKHDEILASLEKIVATRQAAVDHAKGLSSQGLMAADDTRTAEVELSLAQVQILQRREQISANASGGALSTLNRDLIDVSLQVDEQQTIIRLLDSRLARLKEATDARTQIRDLRRQENILRDIEEVDNRLKNLPPQ